jgi:cysteine desulfurase/selenocysteine lyase
MSILPVSEARARPHSEALPPLFDLARVRENFPILNRQARGWPLIYLDNAATTQKPRAVIDAVAHFYERHNANVHRGVHLLSQLATQEYEEARVKVQRFLNAASLSEIVFTRGTTESINLVAQTFGRKNIGPGDEVLVSHMEHHSNIVPWQMLCEEKGAVLRVVPINDRGELLLDEYEKLLGPRTKLLAVVHVSNSLGTVNPVRTLIEMAHRRCVPVLLDGAQAVAHFQVDVQALDCDFYALSGHKLYGPTGIGVLYGKRRLLDAMPPYQGGGDMIASVTFARTTYAEPPSKFEAGTPHIAGAIGLGVAIDYLQSLGLDNVAAHEHDLLRHATDKVKDIPGVRIIGTAADKVGVLSFVVEDPPLAALDVGTQLDLQGIAVRTGHHCCQPVMERFGVPATSRASFALYNSIEEVDRFADVLRRIVTAAAARVRPAPVQPNGQEPAYPKATAPNPQAAADKLAGRFELLDDWAERYAYLLDLGKKIPPLPDQFRSEANRVHGCQSTVFLTARKQPGSLDTLEFLADSDADLVRGLIALLEKVFSGQKAEQIVGFNVEGFFGRLGLDQHLTLGRRNGLAAMVQRIRDLATSVVRSRGPAS